MPCTVIGPSPAAAHNGPFSRTARIVHRALDSAQAYAGDVNRARRLLGALAVMGALVACGAGSEGTVVAKSEQAAYDRACRAGGTLSSPVAVPAWGSCAAPRCWWLIVRDSGGNLFAPCVSRDVYDRTELGAFWHGSTDG